MGGYGNNMFQRKNAPRQGLNVIIIGCGKVGATLVEQLSREGHDITIIDQNRDLVQELSGLYDIMGIIGNGASYSVQMEAGITSADLLIAVTASDELNLLCCTIAKQVGDCATIARVRTPDYSKEANYLRERLGLALIINPELMAARETATILSLPTALEINAFAHGQAEMIKFKVPKDNYIDGMTVAELGQSHTTNIHICAIERNNTVYIPSGNFQIAAGDMISFITSRKVAKAFFKDIGYKNTQVKSAMIIGGGTAAYYLAQQLISIGVSVKIIEQDRKRCESLSILLPKAIIINGDGTDQSLLEEEGIRQTEAFIPLTGIDEENMLMSIFASMHNVPKVLSKVNRTELAALAEKMGLDCIISPKNTTSNILVRYARALRNSMGSNVETLYKLMDGKAEALEFNVKADSKLLGIPLKDLNFKPNILIGGIMRGRKTIIPSGDDVIMAEDRVIVIAADQRLQDLSDIIR